MSYRLSGLFGKGQFIFVLAIALGFAIGHLTVWLKPALLPILAIAMTLSMSTISNRDLASLRNKPRPIAVSFLLNYTIMSGTLLLIGKWGVDDPVLWGGVVILAAMPPATSVMPFTYLLGGDATFALTGTGGLYLLSLVLAPGITLSILGQHVVETSRLLLVLVQLIVVPLLLSRALISTGLDQHIAKWRTQALNWCYFVVIFVIIGLNREFFFQAPLTLGSIVAMAAVATFGLGTLVNLFSKKLNIDPTRRISWVVMSTRKNHTLASVIAIGLLGEKAALPSAILAIFSALYFVWLSFYVKKTHHTPATEQSQAL